MNGYIPHSHRISINSKILFQHPWFLHKRIAPVLASKQLNVGSPLGLVPRKSAASVEDLECTRAAGTFPVLTRINNYSFLESKIEIYLDP
jgi:hypothetical protein